MPDATHVPSFYQVEGLLVDSNVKMTDLLGSLEFFVKSFFGKETKTRVYGHHFPYTEPSVEVEVYYPGRGWLEILGAGMVHPTVLKNGRIDSNKHQGWAFGMGPDRLAMLKYKIDDIRVLYTNDLRFLNQF
jgi:phenylalanyl-tRNA synthetase alpha chain